MGLSIGTKLAIPSLRDLPKLTIPFDIADQTLAGLQQQQDMYEVLASKTPRYLPNVDAHRKVVSQIDQYRQQMQEKLSQVAEQGDVSTYIQMLSEVGKNFASMYSPGGVAYNLERDVEAYQKAIADIKEHTKDFTNPYYRQYFTYQLQDQLKSITEEDVIAGTSGISTPNLFGEYDILANLDEFLKGFMPDQDIKISRFVDPTTGRIDPDAIQILKEKGVSAEEVLAAIDRYFQQPQVRQAMMVESEVLLRNLSEEDKQQLVQEYIHEKKNEIDKTLYVLLDHYDEFKNASQRGKLRIAKANGFETATAYEAMLQERIGAFESLKDAVEVNANARAAVYDQIEKRYKSIVVPKHSYLQQDVEIKFNTARLKRQQLNLYKQLIQYQRPINMVVPQKTSKEQIKGFINSFKEIKNILGSTLQSIANDKRYRDLWTAIDKVKTYGIDKATYVAQLEDLVNRATDNNGNVDKTKLKEFVLQTIPDSVPDRDNIAEQIVSSVGDNGEVVSQVYGKLKPVVDEYYNKRTTIKTIKDQIYRKIEQGEINITPTPELIAILKDMLPEHVLQSAVSTRIVGAKGSGIVVDEVDFDKIFNYLNSNSDDPRMAALKDQTINALAEFMINEKPEEVYRHVDAGSIDQTLTTYIGEGELFDDVNARLNNLAKSVNLLQYANQIAVSAYDLDSEDYDPKKVSSVNLGFRKENGIVKPVLSFLYDGKQLEVDPSIDGTLNATVRNLLMHIGANNINQREGALTEFEDPAMASLITSALASIDGADNVTASTVTQVINSLDNSTSYVADRIATTTVSVAGNPVELDFLVSKGGREGEFYIVAAPRSLTDKIEKEGIDNILKTDNADLVYYKYIPEPSNFTSIDNTLSELKSEIFTQAYKHNIAIEAARATKLKRVPNVDILLSPDEF